MKIALRGLFMLILAMFYVSSNGFTYEADLTGFKAIHISNIWQIPLATGEHSTWPNTPDIIYSKDYKIIRSVRTRTTMYVKVSSTGEEETVKPNTLDTICAFFICRTGEKYGLLYDSLSTMAGKPYRVDSLINDFLRFPAIFYNGRGKGKDSISTIRDDKKGLLTERIIQRKYDELSPDTSYFYYRKKQLDYSYLIKDKRADNMYLYKAIIIYNHIPKAQNVNNISDEKTKFRHSFEITEIDVPDKENIKNLIEKFKRSSKGK